MTQQVIDDMQAVRELLASKPRGGVTLIFAAREALGMTLKAPAPVLAETTYRAAIALGELRRRGEAYRRGDTYYAGNGRRA